MSAQGTLFDLGASRAAKDEGMRRVAAHAPAAWLAAARAAVLSVARRGEEFTSDDVWQTGLPSPPEPRALGAVMGELARVGLIAQTGRYVRTARRTRHNAPVAVWLGIYQP